MSFSKLLTRAPFLKSSLLFLANLFFFFSQNLLLPPVHSDYEALKGLGGHGFQGQFSTHFLSQETKALLLAQNCQTQVILFKKLGRRGREAALSADFTAGWIKKKSEVWQIHCFSKNAALISGLL